MSNTALDSVNPEKQFVKTYVQLMDLSKNATPDQFNSTHDYNNLASLGPSLPKFKYQFPAGSTDQDSGNSIIIAKFKSIKPPFKFATDLNISSSESIYKIKMELIDSVESLKNSNIKPQDVKLMVKSKVAQDTSTLSTLAGENQEISFNCIISNTSSTTSTKEPEPAIATSNDDPDIEQPFDLSATSWSKIYEILLSEVKDPTKAKNILQNFKQSI
ncbi:uncharacterized protein KGF55_002099 [Candida pseudojiufengensis]|uniref:uncharacterized protein n=1 Tax=Candida pseudojiufengensis TaxID=497109 RepID=UPI00222503D1|nr:uncharacterized protein KGF55_002099 [Candida pseudojiufengensis]KAI5964157.1 hypothetical protein KGF55_002099 [Candida pseudojiufengensis]